MILSYLLRYCFAYGLVFLCLVLNLMALPYPFNGPVKVPLVLMCIYYWSVYRPSFMPAWLVFLLGLIMDIISGMPLGLNAFVYMVFQWITIRQRRVLTGQSFLVIWTGFTALLCGTFLLRWGLFGVLFTAPPIKPFFITGALSLSLFPLVSLILHYGHKALPMPTRDKLFQQGT